jgi:hypothetical protein
LPFAWKIGVRPKAWLKASEGARASGRSDCRYNPDPAQANLADPNDLCETVKKAEDISCAVQNVFDSLATYVVFRVAFEGVGGDYGAEGRSAAAAYLIVPSAKVEHTMKGLRSCMQLFCSWPIVVIQGRKRGRPAQVTESPPPSSPALV